MENEQRVKTEFHLHTAETSPCGMVPGREMIQLCADKGFGGVIVTDHYLPGSFDRPETRDLFLAGYRQAKQAGDALGVVVLPGMEIRFAYGDEDFLVYGMEEADFAKLPYDLCQYALADFYAYCHDHGYLLFQAHPFRQGLTAQDPRYLDGVEVRNGNPRQINNNHLALAFAREHNLLETASGDVHQTGDVRDRAPMVPQALLTPKGILQYLRENPRVAAEFEESQPERAGAEQSR